MKSPAVPPRLACCSQATQPRWRSARVNHQTHPVPLDNAEEALQTTGCFQRSPAKLERELRQNFTRQRSQSMPLAPWWLPFAYFPLSQPVFFIPECPNYPQNPEPVKSTARLFALKGYPEV